MRDYGVKGQLGLEPTFEEYITKLCDIFDEVKRALKPTGTCWVNIGDTYMGNSSYSEGGRQGFDGSDGHMNQDKWPDPKYKAAHGKRLRVREHVKRTIKSKSLAGIPFRFAIEMINRGWVLRNTIIWHKPNCMPSSVNDRFTVDFEYVFLFSKSNGPQYWTNKKTSELSSKVTLGTKGIEETDWDWIRHSICNGTGVIDEAPCRKCDGSGKIKMSHWKSHNYYFEKQFESWTDERKSDIQRAMDNHKGYQGKYGEGYNKDMRESLPGQGIKGQPVGDPSRGRNKRCVWKIPTQPLKEAHFATFPEALIEPMIKAGCPEFVCRKCGNPRENITSVVSNIRAWNSMYFWKLLLGNSHSNSSYKKAFELMKKWMCSNENYNYQDFYEWYCKQKNWSNIHGNLVEGHSAKFGNMLPFPRPEKRLPTVVTGYSSCFCNAGFSPGVVLDPFMGAGTTALVSKKLDRNFLGFELNEEYIEIANKRIRPWMEQQKLG